MERTSDRVVEQARRRDQTNHPARGMDTTFKTASTQFGRRRSACCWPRGRAVARAFSRRRRRSCGQLCRGSLRMRPGAREVPATDVAQTAAGMARWWRKIPAGRLQKLVEEES